jgi:elongation factor P
MPKILATEIRVGVLLALDKHLWRVLKCYHVHVGGRGGAYMQVELKDIQRGTKTNQRFNTDEKIEKANLESRNMEYLYADGDTCIFMDTDDFEQLSLAKDFLEEQLGYLMNNTPVQVNFYNGNAISVTLPPTVILEVISCDPVIKGASVTSSFKPAVMSTNISIAVPSFIEVGEHVKINTDTGEYMERV